MSKDSPIGGAGWQSFERIVAAIHKLRDRGAQVRWNEVIKGRQLDVTVRFARAGYEFLIVVECKNTSRPVSVDEVDAFVTKSKDLGANKAVMVSSAGYQSGAKEVAARHGIQLLTLDQIATPFGPSEIVVPEPSLNLLQAVLWVTNQLAPIVYRTKSPLNLLRLCEMPGGRQMTLAQFLSEQYKLADLAGLTARRVDKVDFEPPWVATLVDGQQVMVRGIDLTIERGTVPRRAKVSPPNLNFLDFVLTDIQTGKVSRFPGAELPIGLDKPFVEGRFYRNIFGLTYFCERVDEKNVQLYAFLGDQQPKSRFKDITARITADVSYAPLYAELADPNEIAKFKELYDRYTRLEGSANASLGS